MSFLQLVRREMRGSLRKLVFMAAVGGISSAAVLAAINAGAQAAGDSESSSLWAVAVFLIALFLFIRSQPYVTTTITAEIEAIIHKLRVRLMDAVRRSELLSIDDIGRSRIVAAINSDSGVLTQASNTLCYSMQSVVLIFFISIYVAYLSLAAFIMSVVIVGLAGTVFHLRSRRLTLDRARAAEQERQLFDRMDDFLDGFKEVRLNSARSVDLFDDAVEVSRAAANIKIGAQVQTFRQIVSVQSYMYVLLGAVVFAAPRLSESFGGASIPKATTALLFVVGACFGLVQSIPILLNANAAADRLQKLVSDLSATASTEPDSHGGAARFRCDRDAQYRVPLRGQIFRHRLLTSGRSTSRCDPASSSSSPAATVRESRPSCGCSPGSIRPIPARSRSTECGSTATHATPIARCSPRFSSTIICFTGSTAYPIRIRSRSTGC